MDQEIQPRDETTAHLRNVLAELAGGHTPARLPDELAARFPELEQLRAYHEALTRFALDISNGNLGTHLHCKGRLAGSLKNLHAGLRHLIWQTKAIARGDFSQRVDFMGEFSQAFNSMVSDLQNARTQLIETNRELQTSNEALIKANALRDKMFSIIGHDLRSPIGGGASLLELLAQDACPFDETRKHTATKALRDSMKSAHQLLENLLAWSRGQMGLLDCQPETIPLEEPARHLLQLMASSASTKKISIACEIPDRITVYADRNMLDTILRNLVGNALKFTPPGGQITLSAQPGPDGQVQLCVADTGLGIHPRDLDRLFTDTTFTTYGTHKEKGSGLGLILCREFVERHGGRIWVDTAPGAGSRFFFTLPAFQGQPLSFNNSASPSRRVDSAD